MHIDSRMLVIHCSQLIKDSIVVKRCREFRGGICRAERKMNLREA